MSRVGHVKLTFKKGNFRVSSLLPSYSIKWVIQNAHQRSINRILTAYISPKKEVGGSWEFDVTHKDPYRSIKKIMIRNVLMYCFVKLFKTRIVTDENK